MAAAVLFGSGPFSSAERARFGGIAEAEAEAEADVEAEVEVEVEVEVEAVAVARKMSGILKKTCVNRSPDRKEMEGNGSQAETHDVPTLGRR